MPKTVLDVLSRDGKADCLSHLLTPADSIEGAAHNVIIGSNSIALQAAVEKCRRLSLTPIMLSAAVCGHAAEVSNDLSHSLYL